MNGPQRFRKKPVVIEAWQWDGDNGPVVAAWCGGAYYRSVGGVPQIVIRTREDTNESAHWSDPGDYIIRGVEGEFYACKPSIFMATYELVEG